MNQVPWWIEGYIDGSGYIEDFLPSFISFEYSDEIFVQIPGEDNDCYFIREQLWAEREGLA